MRGGGGSQAAAPAQAAPAAPLDLAQLDGLALDAFVQGYAKYVREREGAARAGARV